VILGADEINPAGRRARRRLRGCCAACDGSSSRAHGDRTSGLGAADTGATIPLVDAFGQLVKALPKCATGGDLVRFMNAALELSSKGFRIGSSETAKAQQALSDAINAPKNEIGAEIPFFPWSTAPTYCAGAGPREKAITLATRAIGGASGDVSATAVKVQAVKELAADLVKPPFGATDWGSFAKKIGIGVAVAGGIYVGGKYVVGPFVAGRAAR
jgi:hypothetical protein